MRGRRSQCCSQPFPCRCQGTLGCSQFSQHSSCPVPAHNHRLGCSCQSPGMKLNPWLKLKWQKTALKYPPGTLFFKCFADPRGSLNERQTLAMSPECNHPETSHLADHHSALSGKQNFIVSFHGSSWRSRLRSKYIRVEKDGQRVRELVNLLGSVNLPDWRTWLQPHTPGSLRLKMFEKNWFCSQNARRWHCMSKDAHFRGRRRYLFSLCCSELAMTSQRAHLLWLYCTLCPVCAANELQTNVHKPQYLHVSLTEYIQGRRGSGCVHTAHISWSSCCRKRNRSLPAGIDAQQQRLNSFQQAAVAELRAAHKHHSIWIWLGHLRSTIKKKKKEPLPLFLTVQKKNHLQKRLTDGTNLLAHRVLCLPNGKGEAGVQDAAVGKHPSSVDVLLTSQAAAVLVVIFTGTEGAAGLSGCLLSFLWQL